ncbi:hypothetical protein HB763_19300 [Vibrio campbellii]|uniref:hypothetical protein n=1 Tax=Vibrio campbellii TaxID=680 RepID=UPI00210F0672|nr:hypothetical protein [Vibrio campbellii]UTZ38753.1 hypothetical protein HB763_19300 [Vibrio campbellii]
MLYSGMSLAAYSPDNSMIEANIYSVDFNTTNQRSVVKVSLFDENNRPFYADDCSDVSVERKAGEDARIGRLDTRVYVANEEHNNNSCYTYFYPGSSAEDNIPGDVIVTAKVGGVLLSGDESEITLTVVGDGSGNGNGICEVGESGAADCDGLCVRPAEANGIDCVTGKELTSISVEPNPLSVVKTLTGNLMATGTFVGGDTKIITGLLDWSSESPLDVEVLSPAPGELDGHLENAVIRGNEVGGPITVKATAVDIAGTPIEGTSEVTVTGPNVVPDSQYVTADPSDIPLGFTSQLKFCVTTEELGVICSTDNDQTGGGDENFITWSPQDIDGLVIDDEGLLTTTKAAADLINTVVTVTATGVVGTAVEGISASTDVSILPPVVDEGASTVTLSADNVEAGTPVQATMYFSFNGGAGSFDTSSSDYVTWSVTQDQGQGVTISTEGLIDTSSVEVGNTTVTVTGQGKAGTSLEGEINTAVLNIEKRINPGSICQPGSTDTYIVRSTACGGPSNGTQGRCNTLVHTLRCESKTATTQVSYSGNVPYNGKVKHFFYSDEVYQFGAKRQGNGASVFSIDSDADASGKDLTIVDWVRFEGSSLIVDLKRNVDTAELTPQCLNTYHAGPYSDCTVSITIQ